MRLPPGRYRYSAKCDIFSYGLTLWEMIARKEPTLGLGVGDLTYLISMAKGL